MIKNLQSDLEIERAELTLRKERLKAELVSINAKLYEIDELVKL